MEQVVTLKVGEATITVPATSVIRQILADIGTQAIPAQPAPVAAPTRPALNEGEHYAGIILDETNDYHLILLPGQVEDIKWKAAKDWAAEQGGELPTRREQALLYANLKEQFLPRWHWSCEEHPTEAHCAFIQDFISGHQNSDREDHEYCARAVRRVSVI